MRGSTSGGVQARFPPLQPEFWNCWKLMYSRKRRRTMRRHRIGKKPWRRTCVRLTPSSECMTWCARAMGSAGGDMGFLTSGTRCMRMSGCPRSFVRMALTGRRNEKLRILGCPSRSGGRCSGSGRVDRSRLGRSVRGMVSGGCRCSPGFRPLAWSPKGRSLATWSGGTFGCYRLRARRRLSLIGLPCRHVSLM